MKEFIIDVTKSGKLLTQKFLELLPDQRKSRGYNTWTGLINSAIIKCPENAAIRINNNDSAGFGYVSWYKTEHPDAPILNLQTDWDIACEYAEVKSPFPFKIGDIIQTHYTITDRGIYKINKIKAIDNDNILYVVYVYPEGDRLAGEYAGDDYLDVVIRYLNEGKFKVIRNEPQLNTKQTKQNMGQNNFTVIVEKNKIESEFILKLALKAGWKIGYGDKTKIEPSFLEWKYISFKPKKGRLFFSNQEEDIYAINYTINDIVKIKELLNIKPKLTFGGEEVLLSPFALKDDVEIECKGVQGTLSQLKAIRDKYKSEVLLFGGIALKKLNGHVKASEFIAPINKIQFGCDAEGVTGTWKELLNIINEAEKLLK